MVAIFFGLVVVDVFFGADIYCVAGWLGGWCVVGTTSALAAHARCPHDRE